MDTNNSSAKKYVAKMSLRPRAQGRSLHGRAGSEKKESFFFLFWLEEVFFHCVEHSNEIELKRQEMRRKKKHQQQKTEISINEEPKLRIKSQITLIIIALDKSTSRL